jgi:hypothetical protein
MIWWHHHLMPCHTPLFSMLVDAITLSFHFFIFIDIFDAFIDYFIAFWLFSLILPLLISPPLIFHYISFHFIMMPLPLAPFTPLLICHIIDIRYYWLFGVWWLIFAIIADYAIISHYWLLIYISQPLLPLRFSRWLLPLLLIFRLFYYWYIIAIIAIDTLIFHYWCHCDYWAAISWQLILIFWCH